MTFSSDLVDFLVDLVDFLVELEEPPSRGESPLIERESRA
jgi:hypothetical protein